MQSTLRAGVGGSGGKHSGTNPAGSGNTESGILVWAPAALCCLSSPGRDIKAGTGCFPGAVTAAVCCGDALRVFTVTMRDLVRCCGQNYRKFLAVSWSLALALSL